jgi:hypothetical protein
MVIMRKPACRGLAVLMILFLLGACAQGNPPSTTPSAEPTMAPPAGEETEQRGEQPTAAQDIAIAPSEMVLYPKEYAAYQAYLDVIKGRPGMADGAVIEGTVLSLATGEVCPYQEEPCRIEAYPDDWGTVRVDKIVEYAPIGEPGSNPVESQDGGTPTGETPGLSEQTSPQYTGTAGQAGPAKYAPLQQGQEVQAHFLLTARPARVRQLATGASAGAEAAQSAGADAGQVVTHQAEPGETTFEPIPREGEAFVFSTIATDARDAGELVLPGLTAGVRFRARVQYDGTLYVQEYELIP